VSHDGGTDISRDIQSEIEVYFQTCRGGLVSDRWDCVDISAAMVARQCKQQRVETKLHDPGDEILYRGLPRARQIDRVNPAGRSLPIWYCTGRGFPRVPLKDGMRGLAHYVPTMQLANCCLAFR
jgi:hypothetical protein